VDFFKLGDLIENSNTRKNHITPLDFEKDLELYTYIKNLRFRHLSMKEDDYESQPNYCGIGYRIVYIRSDGLVTGCTEMTDKVSDFVFTFDFNNIEDWKKTIPFKNIGLLNEKSICYKCGLVHLCYGGCRARAFKLTKNVNGCDLYRRKKIEFLLNKIVN